MRKILVISSRTINLPTLELIQTIMNGFEIKHCFLTKEIPFFEEGIDGILFNHDTDYFEITRTLKLLEKEIPVVRIYPSFWGYSEIETVKVVQTMPEASNLFKVLFNN